MATNGRGPPLLEPICQRFSVVLRGHGAGPKVMKFWPFNSEDMLRKR